MKRIRTILVDDERVGRARLRRLLEKESDIEVVSECADGPSAVRAVQEHHPDLLFLDMRMPGMDGFDVLDALGPEQNRIAVIFVTAYDKHAVRAFEACALDYLLKPASPERLAKAVARARARIQSERDLTPAGSLQVALEASPTHARSAAVTAPHRFAVRSAGRISFVAPDEIDWIEAAGNYAILHTGAANHMIRETMSALEAQLPDTAFLRVSRSAIVNLQRVKELRATTGAEHEAILTTGARVPITRSWREVADRLSQL
jgi:two-component system, LytTR family, response regulator